MSKDKDQEQKNQLPQWVYLAAMLLGFPLAGGTGLQYGVSQAAVTASEDVRQLEVKVDDLGDQLDILMLAIVRVHPEAKVLSP